MSCEKTPDFVFRRHHPHRRTVTRRPMSSVLAGLHSLTCASAVHPVLQGVDSRDCGINNGNTTAGESEALRALRCVVRLFVARPPLLPAQSGAALRAQIRCFICTTAVTAPAAAVPEQRCRIFHRVHAARRLSVRPSDAAHFIRSHTQRTHIIRSVTYRAHCEGRRVQPSSSRSFCCHFDGS